MWANLRRRCGLNVVLPGPVAAFPVHPRTTTRAIAQYMGGGDKAVKWSAGDWRCAKCRVQNFKANAVCFSCKAERPAELGYTRKKLTIDGQPKETISLDDFKPPPPASFLAGDFECLSCGAHNFANLPGTKQRRTTCHKCGNPAPKTANTAGKHEAFRKMVAEQRMKSAKKQQSVDLRAPPPPPLVRPVHT